jgi:hypothetical protein
MRPLIVTATDRHVRFFMRHELTRCSLDAKVREYRA